MQQAGTTASMVAPVQALFEKFSQAAAWKPALNGTGAEPADSTLAASRKRTIHAS